MTGATKAAAAVKFKALQGKHGVRGLLARKDLENDLVEYVYARCMNVKAVYSGYSEVQRVEMEFRFKGDFEVV